MKSADEKTNVMRLLDAKKIPYTPHWYEDDGSLGGANIARVLGEDPRKVFKTLVTRGGKGMYVFLVPVEQELDLKKAAKAAGDKYVEMIRSAELLPLTGYIHGGCSPIGMKKRFPTFVDETARDYERICFSAGRVGCQVEASPDCLTVIVNARFVPLTCEG